MSIGSLKGHQPDLEEPVQVTQMLTMVKSDSNLDIMEFHGQG